MASRAPAGVHGGVGGVHARGSERVPVAHPGRAHPSATGADGAAVSGVKPRANATAGAAADAAVARLLETLRRSFDGGAWHGPSLREALDGCSAADAAAHPIAGAHSVWELVLHAAAWADEVAARVGGARPGTPPAGDWPPVPDSADAAAWRAACGTLGAARDRLLAAVAAVAPERLGQPLPAPNVEGEHAAADALGTRDTLHGTIIGLAEHNAYHGGQMVLLRRALAGRPA